MVGRNCDETDFWCKCARWANDIDCAALVIHDHHRRAPMTNRENFSLMQRTRKAILSPLFNLERAVVATHDYTRHDQFTFWVECPQNLTFHRQAIEGGWGHKIRIEPT
jgi:hypothetical protein